MKSLVFPKKFKELVKNLLNDNDEISQLIAKVRLCKMIFDWIDRNKLKKQSREKLLNMIFELTPIELDDKTYDLTLQYVKAHDVDGLLSNESVSLDVLKKENLRKFLGFFLMNLRINRLDYMQLLNDFIFLDKCISSYKESSDNYLPF